MATNYNIGYPHSDIFSTTPYQVTPLEDIFVPKEFLTTGVIESWGKNDNGELGDANSPTSKTTPEPTFYNFGDFRKVDSGDGFAAGLAMNGDLYVWGDGKDGIFGDGQTTSYNYPRLVSGHKWYDFACGNSHIVGLKQDGTLYWWGRDKPTNSLIYTSPTTALASYSWVELPDQYVARKVWAGWYNIFILATGSMQSDQSTDEYHDIDGRIYSLHLNSDSTNYIIGRDGSTGNNRRFYDIQTAGGPSYYTEIGTYDSTVYPKDLSTGPTSTGIIGPDGRMWWMGDNRSDDGLGNAFIPTTGSTPQDFYAMTPIESIDGDDYNWKRCSAGHYFQAAIRENGTLWMWGNNQMGQLGQNTPDNTHYSSPVQVPGTTWASISGSYGHTIASKTDNTMWVWGENSDGAFGMSDPVAVNASRSSPIQLPGTDWDAQGDDKLTADQTVSQAMKGTA